MSPYAKYMKEAFGREVIEDESGFISFYALPEAPQVCYMVDVYVEPEFRGKRESEALQEKVIAKAREMGCTKAMGSVNVKLSTPEKSMSIFLKYGYKLSHLNGDLIFFFKDIQGDL